MFIDYSLKSACHAEHLSGNEGRLFRAEIQDAVRDLVRASDALERRFVRQRLHDVPAVHRVHVGVDDAGRDAVDADAARPELERERFRQTDERRLARGVMALAGDRL